jgi:hypothetical protein
VGTVTFTDGNSTLASIPLRAGKASMTTSTLRQGRHAFRAIYDGAPFAKHSNSSLVSETVRSANSKGKPAWARGVSRFRDAAAH